MEGTEMNERIQTEWTLRMLGILRIVAGFLFTAHGTQKLFNYPAGSGAVELFSLMGFAGLLEFVGGALLMVGLLTRTTGFILSGLMAAAYFMAHAPAGFLPLVNKGELAVLYSFLFLFFTFAGPGRFSLDGLIARRHFARQSVTGPTPEAV
jgi:putative oxidoreductase